jgi:hypothetical protein
VLRAKFPGEHPGELMQCRFTAGIGVVWRLRDVDGSDAADVDDPRGVLGGARAPKRR